MYLEVCRESHHSLFSYVLLITCNYFTYIFILNTKYYGGGKYYSCSNPKIILQLSNLCCLHINADIHLTSLYTTSIEKHYMWYYTWTHQYPLSQLLWLLPKTLCWSSTIINCLKFSIQLKWQRIRLSPVGS